MKKLAFVLAASLVVLPGCWWRCKKECEPQSCQKTECVEKEVVVKKQQRVSGASAVGDQWEK